jgi:hypothetical protein
MPIYLGNTQLGSDYYGNLSQGKIYQGSNLVQDGIYGESNLIALYNIADSNCYPGSGDTIYDLSSNGNNLTLTGSIDYIAASSSLQINSGSAQIYSPNQLINNYGNNLLGTTGEFTVIAFLQSVNYGDYNPTWYIGGTSATSNAQIVNSQQNSFALWKVGFGTSTTVYNQSAYNATPTGYYVYGDDTGFSGNRRWSMLGYTKTNQSSQYNVRIDMQGYKQQNSSTWQNSSLLSAQWAASGFPNINSNSTNPFTTNLTSQYLYIGKNPLSSTSEAIFQFGGMAIFGRALTSNEVSQYWNYFTNGRTA